MKNKVLIKVFFPELSTNYDIFIPVNEQVWKVNKLICKGTIEEKIDALIKSKVELSQNVIGSGNENWITEMDNQELMKLLRLEVNH